MWALKCPNSPLVSWIGKLGEKLYEYKSIQSHSLNQRILGVSELSPKLILTMNSSQRSIEGRRDTKLNTEAEKIGKVYEKPEGFVVGDSWYIISRDWFMKWSLYR